MMNDIFISRPETRDIVLSLLAHLLVIAIFLEISGLPFGGGPGGVIVVNLASLDAGQGPSSGSKKPSQTTKASSPSSRQTSQAVPSEVYADVGSSPQGNLDGEPASPLLFGIGGLDRVPAISEYVEVEYPANARRDVLEGEVIVKILISREGSVEAAEAVKYSSAILRDAVLKAVRRWRFEPPTVRGRPISLYMIIPFKFRLE